LPLLNQLDAWHRDAAARHPGVIPCRPGCTACCHGPFDISVADVEAVRAGFQALDAEAKAAVTSAATAHLDRMRELAPEWKPPSDIAAIGDARFDQISDALADLPCPCLDAAG